MKCLLNRKKMLFSIRVRSQYEQFNWCESINHSNGDYKRIQE